MEEGQFESKPSFFRTKRYFLFWISSLFSNIGTWMQQVAQPWIILTISHSAFWVGVDSFMLNAPGWVLTLWGGYIADRFDRKKIVLVCQSIQWLFVLILFILILLNRAQIWIILTCSFVIGSTDSLSMPSFQSIIPSMVEQNEIPKAISFNSTQFNLSRILGPTLAGIIISKYGVTACYGANLVSYIPFFFSLYWIYPKSGFKKEPVVSTKASQYFLLLKDRHFNSPLMTVFVMMAFCAPMMTFTPVLIKNIFHGSASQLGWAMALFGFGGVIGAIFPAILSEEDHKLRVAAHGIAILTGILLLLVKFVSSVPLLFLMLFCLGLFLAASNTVVNSLLQKRAQNQIRGKIISLFQLSLQGGMALGGFMTGMLSSVIDVRDVLSISGVIATCLQVVIFIYGTFYFRRDR